MTKGDVRHRADSLTVFTEETIEVRAGRGIPMFSQMIYYAQTHMQSGECFASVIHWFNNSVARGLEFVRSEAFASASIEVEQ